MLSAWSLLWVAVTITAFDERVSGRTMLTDIAWMKVDNMLADHKLYYHKQSCFKCKWAMLLVFLTSLVAEHGSELTNRILIRPKTFGN